MKAYKDNNGGIRLFRPNKNMERLNKSSARIALPTVNGDELTKVIGEFVKLDSRFIPESVCHEWFEGLR
jgi:branched-chain amino acid aminotransferase